MHQPMAAYSIKEQFSGRVVLLTGASGYIGGLVLECLLRTTDVAHIYVLLRSKGSSSTAQRLSQLLQGRLFHKVRNNQQLLSKVTAVAGDITQPDLALASTVRSQLQQEVNIILHCAADIRLEVDIQSALAANYFGLQALLELAAQVINLLAFVHVSSCFVNMNQPVSSVVAEKLYPLSLGSQTVDCRQLVQDLMLLPAGAANTRATALGLRWGFPNNYTFSKHLAEQLVSHHQRMRRLPVAIVRPSLVCAVAYEPIPGHAGNYAGPIGASAALALGFYHSLKCVSSQPLHCWDIMPADLVANAVLAAAAATAAASCGNCSALLTAAAAVTCNAAATGAAAIGGMTHTPGTIEPAVCGSMEKLLPLLIVQSSSSSTYPITLLEGWNHAVEFVRCHPPKFRLCSGFPPEMTAQFRPDPAAVRRQRRWIAFKVAIACWLLRLFGLRKAAARLHSGYEALCVYGTSKTDKDLVFSSAALQCLEEALLTAEQQQYPLVMRPGMPLPQSPAAAATIDSKHSSDSNSSMSVLNNVITTGAEEEAASDVALHPLCGSDTPSNNLNSQQQQCLTWRRYFHSQLAAVYSLLFRTKVPLTAPGGSPAGAPPVQHDFVYIP